jgi:hypothetical protein
MQALPALEVPPTYQPQPYRGVTRRRTAAERKIDDSWLRGDVDATISAVVDHVSEGGTKPALASRVAMVVLRSLPGYSGPQAPLSTYDGRIPLSSFVNMKAKQARMDMARERKVIKSHETLACELLVS